MGRSLEIPDLTGIEVISVVMSDTVVLWPEIIAIAKAGAFVGILSVTVSGPVAKRSIEAASSSIVGDTFLFTLEKPGISEFLLAEVEAVGLDDFELRSKHREALWPN